MGDINVQNQAVKPTPPSTNFSRLYPRDDGNWYHEESDGIEKRVTNDQDVTPLEARQGIEAENRAWSPADIRTAIDAIFETENFHSNNVNSETIAKLGWATSGTGLGNLLSFSQESGHPGIAILNPGSADTGRRLIFLSKPGAWLLSTSGFVNNIEVEWLIKITGTLTPSVFDILQLGLADPNFTADGPIQDGVYVLFDPSLGGTFFAATSNGGTRTIQAGTTTVVADTWYRVSIVYSVIGVIGNIQLKVNGVNEGSAISTNLPTISLSYYAKIDALATIFPAPTCLIDRMRVFHTPKLED